MRVRIRAIACSAPDVSNLTFTMMQRSRQFIELQEGVLRPQRLTVHCFLPEALNENVRCA
jgi:hypothetical protein